MRLMRTFRSAAALASAGSPATSSTARAAGWTKMRAVLRGRPFLLRSPARLIVLQPHVDRRRFLPGEAQVHVAAPPVVEPLDRAVEADLRGQVVPGLARRHDLGGGVVRGALIGPAAH